MLGGGWGGLQRVPSVNTSQALLCAAQRGWSTINSIIIWPIAGDSRGLQRDEIFIALHLVDFRQALHEGRVERFLLLFAV